MAENLSRKIKELENKIKTLESKVMDLSKKTEAKRIKPESRVPLLNLGVIGRPLPSTGTGLGKLFARQGNIIWNDADTQRIAFGIQPPDPEKGYNKHGHSEFAGGALDIHTLQLVEYETQDPEVENPIILDSEGEPVNKHCQAYWKIKPNIKKEGDVEKIGLLDIEFDAVDRKWVAGAGMIDVEKTYLVQYIYKLEDVEVPEGTEGATKEIRKDKKGKPMKAPLLSYTMPPIGESESKRLIRENEMLEKSNVYWDEAAECWRFYAIFKPEPEEAEE